MQTTMSFKERLVHMVLFEIGAVTVASLAILLASEHQAGSAISVSVLLAMMAMAWNLLFNIGFDKVFTAPRETRTVGVRVLHTLGFEGGLLIFTVPMIAYLLGLSWWQAFWADIGLTAVVTVYAFVFNWIYDNVRLKFVR